MLTDEGSTYGGPPADLMYTPQLYSIARAGSTRALVMVTVTTTSSFTEPLKKPTVFPIASPRVSVWQ
jgi:hypothetical protein